MRTTTRTRRLLPPLVAMLAAGSIAVASGATFTATSSTAPSVVASGTLTLDNTKDGVALFDGSDLKPGDTVSGSATVTNDGSLPAGLTLTEAAGASDFSDPALLQLTIDEDGSQVYDGDFGGAGTIDLGTFAAGESRTYDVTVTFASSAGNVDQGRTASATYTWDAVQTP